MTAFTIAISGSRVIADQSYVDQILDEESVYYLCLGYDLLFRIGDAIGVDHCALQWARSRGFARRIYFADPKGFEFWSQSVGLRADDDLESAVLAANWDRDGRSAGPLRNAAMIGLDPAYRPRADLLVAIWDGASRGTRNCAATARNAGVFIHQWGGAGPIQFASPQPRDAELVQFHP